MGREATCTCSWGGKDAEVKALLESQELILRGAIKKKIPLAEFKDVRAQDEDLIFKVGRERVALSLGSKDAASWAKKILTPPPSLKDKLGLKDGAKAFVIGAVKDKALADALKGATTKTIAKAAIAVAVVENDADLAHAIRGYPKGPPIWVVHRKGKAALFGEAPIRIMMRTNDFMDTKVSAVSADFSATRYSRKR